MPDDKTPLARWQHVLSLLAVVATCGGIYLAYLSRDRARLDLVKVSESVIADLKSSETASLQLTFDGAPIRRASVMTFQLTNSGNVHLAQNPSTKEDDPRNPSFTISLPDPPCRLLSAIARAAGDDQNAMLQRVTDSVQNSLSYRVIVLNAGASVQIDAVVADCAAPIATAFSARGLGLKGRVLPSLDPGLSSWWQYALVAVLAVFIVAFLRPFVSWVSAPLVRIGKTFSMIGAASYFIIWDFSVREPTVEQRAEGLQTVLLLLVFVGAFTVLAGTVAKLLWTL